MLIDGNIIFILIKPELHKHIVCFLKLRCNNILLLRHIHCKGNQGGRNINIIKGSGHTVLSTDGRKSVSNLCIISTKECCKGLAPSLGIRGHTSEIFLEGKSNLAEVTATCHDLCHGFRHSINCPVIRAPGGKIRIKAIAHHCHGICLSLQHRKLSHHGLCFCQLIFTAIRHQHAACTNRRVKHFHQSLL